jgi:O-antigen/teichoic acid export membrane protein
VASNFAVLGLAEVVCRALSVLVTLALARRLGSSGLGRVMFAFNVVFWLVLVVRDCFETVVTREIARHPGVTRGLVNHVLAVKLVLALALLVALAAAGAVGLSDPVDRWILILYGLLLLTTALGLDFVFRGKETVGLVALSLGLRTAIYCAGVWWTVTDVSRIVLVPIWLTLGEFTGIALVWAVYVKEHGVPRPGFRPRRLLVLFGRGRSVGLIHFCQAVIMSADLTVVGLMSGWSDVGHYGAPQLIVSAVMAFGIILQQVVLPPLSRSGSGPAGEGRRVVDFAVRVLVTGFVPVAVGGAVLAGPLMRLLFPAEYGASSGLLLALGIWKAPVLCLAFLYQTALIALKRESEGLRLLVWGSVGSVPMIALSRWAFDLPGASVGVLVVGSVLAAAGYARLAAVGHQPAAGHHLLKPAVGSVVMVPVCLAAAKVHVALGVAAGAAVYVVTLKLIGGLDFGCMPGCREAAGGGEAA